MKKNKYIFGSVSQWTMRDEDLIPALLCAAEKLRLSATQRNESRKIRARSTGEGYFDSEQCRLDIESLFDILNNNAPPYFYFGSSPFDGADFGFWLRLDFPGDMFNGFKTDDLARVPRGYTGEVLHTNDHGNMALYSCTRGRLREIWAIV